jgi:hypothetical protein
MAVVSNSGPLIALARIGSLELLPLMYEMVIIPPAVFAEVTQHSSRPGATELLQATWLYTVAVQQPAKVQQLRLSLDQGESEALVLAEEQQKTLLIDEHRGRMIAAQHNIPHIGTVGLLLDARLSGSIPALTPLLDALQAAGVHLSRRLYQHARQMAGEIAPTTTDK